MQQLTMYNKKMLKHRETLYIYIFKILTVHKKHSKVSLKKNKRIFMRLLQLLFLLHFYFRPVFMPHLTDC